MKNNLNRRNAIKNIVAASSTVFLPAFIKSSAKAQVSPKKYVFVIGAVGGASILDSFLPIAQSENNGLNSYADDMLAKPAGSNLRCVKPIPDNSIQGATPLGVDYSMETFLQKNFQDTVVVSQECTSVNHGVGRVRALTGDNIFSGRTLTEAVAGKYGNDLLLANCNLSTEIGFNVPGSDNTLERYAVQKEVQDPLLFGLASHRTLGIAGAPQFDMMEKARAVRKEMDKLSPKGVTFYNTQLIKSYLSLQNSVPTQFEQANLINKLNLLQDTDDVKIADYGLTRNPNLDKIMNVFPNYLNDPFEAQASLAYLLVKNQFTCSVTLSPSSMPVFDSSGKILNPPNAFDYSHNQHGAAQNAMWNRVCKVADGLITLLKQEQAPQMDGTSLWDHSLIYVATEFGRDKSGAGTGHHLNNGNLLISPLLKGNQFYGSLDVSTGLTTGFDPVSGNPGAQFRLKEGHVYSLASHALGVEFPGRIDFPAVVK